MPRQTLPDAIREWVAREFNPDHIELVTGDLIDVATGNRAGNVFEIESVRRIIEEQERVK